MKWFYLILTIPLLLKKNASVKVSNNSQTVDLDKRTYDNIMSLHPKLRATAFKFIKECRRKGYNLIVTQGYRSFEEQEKMFDKGVSKAHGGQSYHNYGLAIDVCLKDGKICKFMPPKECVSIAKKYGFEWGGDWQNFHDYPHFQKRFGYHWSELKRRLKKGHKYVKL